ncbi:Plastidal glycolate/glycerate translocator 1, chloroplastic [Galdieria sulphuraria]|nr:Plastidal glycolate/glycerate translocator 1, chloroplastic [Galdieria sulphuraria]
MTDKNSKANNRMDPSIHMSFIALSLPCVTLTTFSQQNKQVGKLRSSLVSKSVLIPSRCKLDAFRIRHGHRPSPLWLTCQDSNSSSNWSTHKLRTWSRIVLGVAILYAIDRCFAFTLNRFAVNFPSSLAGMLTIFILLLAFQNKKLGSLSISQHIFDGFLPSVQFLSRWLAVFFVPNLVMLPLFPVKDPLELTKMGVLIVICLVATLLFTAFLSSFLGRKESQWKKLSVQSSVTSLKTYTSPPSVFIISFWSLISISSAIGLYYQKRLSYAFFYLYSLSTTLSGFCLGQWIPVEMKKFIHPITFCTLFAMLSLFLIAKWIAIPFHVTLNTYLRRGVGLWKGGAGSLLLTFLSPAVVSFAFQICTLASLFGLFSTAYVAKLLQLSPITRVSLIPRSITVPLAVAISSMLNGDISLTSTAVAVTGMIGANINKELLSLLGIHQSVARGISTGASAHGLGTAAMAEEPEAFPFAAISMTLVATISTILTSFPLIRRWLLWVAGI